MVAVAVVMLFVVSLSFGAEAKAPWAPEASSSGISGYIIGGLSYRIYRGRFSLWILVRLM